MCSQHDHIYNVYQQIGAVYFLDSYNWLHLRYVRHIIMYYIMYAHHTHVFSYKFTLSVDHVPLFTPV